MDKQINKQNSFNNIYNIVILILFSSILNDLHCQNNYPFNIPQNTKAIYEVNTTVTKEKFNNNLLGYNIFGFTTSTEKDFIRKFDPITIRFPHGLYANWYDWNQDKTRIFGDASWPIDKKGPIQTFDRTNTRVGFPGLTALNTQKKNATGSGYDILWTYNMSADGSNFNSSTETTARYRDSKNKGLYINHVEMGNENFYKGQRSSIIPTETEYIARAKAMSRALKAINPNVKVSVPLLKTGSFTNPNWNRLITADSTYFDAITVHKYVGSDPDAESDGETNTGYGFVLTARLDLESAVNFARTYVPKKPVWLTEWGVKAGSTNGASVLGMADCYLFLSENQRIYKRANWFSVNGKLNSFVIVDDRSKPIYPLKKTGYGSCYEVIRSVFENSYMYKGNMTTYQLVNKANAVNARMVVNENNEQSVFAVNLTNKPIEFVLKIDGSVYNKKFTHKAMRYNSVSEEKAGLDINTSPLSLVKTGFGTITLPPLSINTISLEKSTLTNQAPVVNLTNPSQNNQEYTLGETIPLTATATDDGPISRVNFKINGNFYQSDTTAPYGVNWTPTTVGTYTIGARVFEEGQEGLAREVSRTVIVKATSNPCAGVNNPTVSITSPTNNATFNQGEAVTIAVNATSSVEIKRVEFFDGTNLVHTDYSEPFSYTSTSLTTGNHIFSAKAFSECNKTAISGAKTIVINSVVTPPPAGGPISGSSCGNAMQALTFELSPQQRANATSYNWYFRGAKESLTTASNGYSATLIPTRGEGEICVGVRYSTGTSYIQYCKTITNCAARTITENNSLTIYPNPSKDGQFSIELKTKADVAISVTDMLGHQIFDFTFKNENETFRKNLDLSKVEKGIYFLNLIYEGKLESSRLIID